MRVVAYAFITAVQIFFICKRIGDFVITVKNINNNVSLCLDSRNQEVIVFGKGVGFIKPPAEVPLAKIDRTFYSINSQFLSFLNDIPSEIIEFTAKEIDGIQNQLPYEMNSNLVLTLADHLAFAIERAKKGIHIPMPSAYEMETGYPLEVKLGQKVVEDLEREFQVLLPRGEAQGIAMHFINARSGQGGVVEADKELQYEKILEGMTRIIEHELEIEVATDTFNYARFATHVQYLLKRVFDQMHIDSTNVDMYRTISGEYKEVSRSVDKIEEYLKNNWNISLTKEEKLYLIMHVNRVCSKN